MPNRPVYNIDIEGERWELEDVGARELISKLTSLIVPIGAILPYYADTLPIGDNFALCNGQTLNASDYPDYCKLKGITASTFTVPDLREATVKGVGTNSQGASHSAIELGAFQDDRNKSHSHTMAHTHTRGTMDIAGTLGSVLANGAAGSYFFINGESGAFYRTTSSGRDAYSEQYNNSGRAVYHFQASRNWTGETSQPSNANTGASGSTTAEVKAIGVNFIIRLK